MTGRQRPARIFRPDGAPRLLGGGRTPHARGLRLAAGAALLGVLWAGRAPAAEVFEKVGIAGPISPTGISFTLPAAARAAGWTLAAEGPGLGMAASNPAFVAGAARAEAALGTTWTHREGQSSMISLVQDVVRFESALASVRLAPVWVAFGYQNPDYVEQELHIFPDSATRLVTNLDVWLLAFAGEVRPGWRLGGSLAQLDQERGSSWRAYQASAGLVVETGRATLGAAFKSELFGQDRSDMLAPSLVQADARFALASRWAAAGFFRTGWWNNTRHGRLRSPVDAGAGVSWQAHAVLRVLAGVHYLRERSECPEDPTNCLLVQRDQGTFLDAGFEVVVSPVRLAVAVEDNRVSSDAATTAVTLSARAAY